MFNRKRYNPDLKAASRAIGYLRAAERELMEINAKDFFSYHQAAESIERSLKWMDELRYEIKVPYVPENED